MGFGSSKPGTRASREIEIVNKLGLHARPCSKFVKLTGKFRCEVSVTKDGDTINGKSIMGLMMLAAGPGSRLMIVCDGQDADDALDAIEKLILSKFDED